MVRLLGKTILCGLATGFTLAIPLGPSGIESVKRSIDNGFWGGFKVSLGAIAADYTYILLINLGLATLLKLNSNAEGFFWIVSGCILVLFNNMSQKSNNKFTNLINSDHKYAGFLSGYILTFINPMTPSLWLVVSGTIMSFWRDDGHMCYIFGILAMLCGTLCWFALLNLLATKGIKYFKKDISGKTSNFIRYFMLVLGICFAIYGLYKLSIGRYFI